MEMATQQQHNSIRRILKIRLALLVLIVLALTVLTVLVLLNRRVPVPEGRVVSAEFVMNPHRFAEDFEILGRDDATFANRELSVPIDGIIGSDASSLFAVVADGRRAFRVFWQHPYCVLHTTRGTYILRLEQANTKRLLNDDGSRLQWLMDLAPRACPRLQSRQLTKAVRDAIRSDPILKGEFDKLNAAQASPTNE